MNDTLPARVPELSVVIPVYNEESILRTSIEDLCSRLDAAGIEYEVVIAENGSRDGTRGIAERLTQELAHVQWFAYPEPNYGGALREGIFRARGTFVGCDEIDLIDVDFHLRALALLRAARADMVVGSKAMHGAADDRPAVRRLATRVYNRVLRVTLGFRGTDTHGLKTFRRAAVTPVAMRCLVEHDVFASELVIRCQRERLQVVEIPVSVHEKRPPSINLLRRVPRVVGNLGRLWLSIHWSSQRARCVMPDDRGE